MVTSMWLSGKKALTFLQEGMLLISTFKTFQLLRSKETCFVVLGNKQITVFESGRHAMLFDSELHSFWNNIHGRQRKSRLHSEVAAENAVLWARSLQDVKNFEITRNKKWGKQWKAKIDLPGKEQLRFSSTTNIAQPVRFKSLTYRN